MSATTVLIIDNHPLYRQGLRSQLEDQGGEFIVVGETDNGEAGVTLTDLHEPMVILVNADTEGLHGLEVIRTLKSRLPSSAVVVLSTEVSNEVLFYALKYGAAAHLLKTDSMAHIIETIRQVAAGAYLINESVLDQPAVAQQVLDDFRTLSGNVGTETEPLFIPLSPREVEVLDHISKGNSNKEIGRNLGISDQTVKNHITSIMRKLAVNDRTQAVVYALRQGWITA